MKNKSLEVAISYNMFRIIAILGAVASTIGLIMLIFFPEAGVFEYKQQKAIQKYDREYILAKLDSLEHIVSLFQSGLAPSDPHDIEFIRKRVNELDEELKDLRYLLLDDPEISVTIPLIKKDINELRSNDARIENELSRVFGLFGWFIPVMFTMVIGLLAIAISLFVKK